MEFSEFLSGLEDYLKDLQKRMSEVEKLIKENYDDRVKEVGDEVLIWDFSSAKLPENISPESLLDKPAIVIANNLSEKIEREIPSIGKKHTYFCDLKLRYIKEGIDVIISSEGVKRTDNYKK